MRILKVEYGVPTKSITLECVGVESIEVCPMENSHIEVHYEDGTVNEIRQPTAVTYEKETNDDKSNDSVAGTD